MRRNTRLAALLAIALVLGSAPGALAEEGGAVRGTVTVEPDVACLLVEGAYDFGTRALAVPDAGPDPLASATSASITSCSAGRQEILVRGTDAVGDGDPPASWTLDPSVAGGSCGLDRFGIEVSRADVEVAPGVTLSTLDGWFTSGLEPAATVSAGADLHLPCLGSAGEGETMTFSVVYTAVLEEPAPSAIVLSVTTSGSGSGTVVSNPPFIHCDPVCTGLFEPGSMVSLTAVPSAGSHLVRWSGARCPADPRCGLTLWEDTSVVAIFEETGPIAEVYPASLDFGEFAWGTAVTMAVEVSNTGEGPLLVESLAVEGAVPGQASVSSTCEMLQPQETCQVFVSVSATAAGAWSATLQIVISANGAIEVFSVPMSGLVVG